MIGIKSVVEAIETYLKSNKFTKTVSKGNIFNIALNKKEIYPISHIICDTFRESGEALVFSISVIFMDIFKDEFTTKHEMSSLALQLSNALNSGELWDSLFQLNNEPTYELFTDRFDDDVAGCTVSFEIFAINDTE